MAEFHQHTDYTNGYRINYPVDWQRQALSPVVTGFFSPQENPSDMFPEAVNVAIEDTSFLLDQYVDFKLAQMQTIGGFQLISRSKTNLAGLPAEKLEVSGQVGPMMVHGRVDMLPLQWLLAVVLKDKRVFVVTYAAEPRAYNKFLPIVQEMLSSLELN